MNTLDKHFVKNKLRVEHYPNIPCKPFIVEVEDEKEAFKIIEVLTQQHLFLFENKFIPDYSNIILVSMWEEDSDGEGNPGWCSYHNEQEDMDWEEFEETYLISHSPNINILK